VHKLDEEKIEEAFKKSYPDLKDDLSKRGYVYLLHDRVLDIESAVRNSEKRNEQGPMKVVDNGSADDRVESIPVLENTQRGNLE
jgi:hypothetical protein